MFVRILVSLLVIVLCDGFDGQKPASTPVAFRMKTDIGHLKTHARTQSTSLVYLTNSNSHDYNPKSINESKSVFQKIKQWLQGNNKEGLTTKERLAKMGLATLLSYGWVSNMSYAVCMGLAWFTFAKQTGVTPLAPGQWKKFLAVYSGFFIFNNALRPICFGLSVAAAGFFEKFVNFIQKKTKARKAVAIGIVVFLFNVCGTFAAMALSIAMASAASGVAIFPPRV